MARLTPPKIAPEDVALYDDLANRGRPVPEGDVAPDPDDLDSLMGQLFHDPARARDISQLVRGLLEHGRLAPALRELAVLRTAATVGSGYEWVTHLGSARRAGLTEEQLESLRTSRDDPSWSPLQRALLQAVDATLACRSIPRDAQETLLGAVSASGLVELILLASTYRMLAGFVAGLDIPLPPGAADPF